MFDRYAIQSQPTQDTSSEDDGEHEVDVVAESSSSSCSFVHNVVVAGGGGGGGDVEEATNAASSIEVSLDIENRGQQTTRQEAARDNSFGKKCWLVSVLCKYTFSTLLLLFSATLVLAAIATEQTTVAANTHPVVATTALVGLLTWLAVMEGGQGCLVGLQPYCASRYAESHVWTHKCTTLAFKSGNLERIIVGRQFLVVLVVFGINSCGSAVANATVLGLPHVVQEIFLGSGVALMLLTIVVGQLTAQVNAANCMLDFLNHRFMLLTVWIALAMEASGLMHAVYLVQMLFAQMTDKPSGTHQQDTTMSRCAKLAFWFRVILSLAVLGFAFGVTLSALFHGQTAMWPGVPEYASVIIFFVLMCFVGLMEGMQIALFAVVNLPAAALEQYPIAKKNYQVVFESKSGGGGSSSKFQALLIGRQICVTICMFLVARITTIQKADDNDKETIFGVPQAVQEFFQTGLLGAVITTIVGSLAWRVVASSFPLAFLSNPLVYVIIHLCLWLEASGVCTSAWLLAIVHKRVAGLQTDDVYLGSNNNNKESASLNTNDATERDATPSQQNGDDDDDDDEEEEC